MKSCFTLFFGLLFIVIGLDIILKFFFKISLPLLKILIALFFIYVGVSILFGKPMSFIHCHNRTEHSDAFCESNYELTGREVAREKVSIVFGSKSVDLTGVKIKGDVAYIKVDCAFGVMKVKIDKDIPIRISGSSAFGQLLLPEGGRAVFGSNRYESEGFSEDKPFIELDASVVFGDLTVSY